MVHGGELRFAATFLVLIQIIGYELYGTLTLTERQYWLTLISFDSRRSRILTIRLKLLNRLNFEQLLLRESSSQEYKILRNFTRYTLHLLTFTDKVANPST